MKVAILFADFGPYHIARIVKLSKFLESKGDELVSIRFCDKVGTYAWDTGIPESVTNIQLLESPPKSKIDAFKIGRRLFSELKRNRIDCILLPSYSPLPNTFAFAASVLAGVRMVLMSDSWQVTESVGAFGRFLKKMFITQFDSALVAGHPQKEYVHGLGLPKERVFMGYDVVDVDYFSDQASKWRNLCKEDVPIPNLPERYFLNLGRFIPKKNIITLIDAYSRYCDKNSNVKIPLVLVGDGPLKEDYVKKCQDLGLCVKHGMTDSFDPNHTEKLVIFYPFQQISHTPIFYTKCEAFILPSIHEEWGLVINEAQACGAPVIVSDKVGCYQDLVEDGANGFVFSPRDVDALADILCRFAVTASLREKLGEMGAKTSRAWTTDLFAENAYHAVKVAKA